MVFICDIHPQRMFALIPPVMEKRITDGVDTDAKVGMKGYIIGNNGSLIDNDKQSNMQCI